MPVILNLCTRQQSLHVPERIYAHNREHSVKVCRRTLKCKKAKCSLIIIHQHINYIKYIEMIECINNYATSCIICATHIVIYMYLVQTSVSAFVHNAAKLHNKVRCCVLLHIWYHGPLGRKQSLQRQVTCRLIAKTYNFSGFHCLKLFLLLSNQLPLSVQHETITMPHHNQ